MSARVFILIVWLLPEVMGADLDLAQARRHWAYRLPVKAAVPAVRDSTWARTDIDRFILERLEARGMEPGAEASREVLVRRLYFDLIGLPPAPEEIDRFVADADPRAAERLAEKLLASPHFGERWGRHWLDVARYAESVTLRGLVFNEAWRYRDYVIESFNRDLPFDQFIKEQISGDLLERATLEGKQRARIATTFLALGNFNYEEQDKEQLRMDIVDEQIDTLGKAFLAQTLGCARCHDHKFDPIPARDYYAMAGILRNTQSTEPANVSTWLDIPLPLAAEDEARVEEQELKLAELQRQIRKKMEAKEDAEPLRLELKRVTEAGPKRPKAMSVKEEALIADCPIHLRGSVHRLAAVVPRGFLQVASYDPPVSISGKESGRRELAEWIASPRNPLTARVIVNRAWHWLMGAGLVPDTDNFGTTGLPPTHPELLDFLAIRLVEHGWPIKQLIREIVFSRAYQGTRPGRKRLEPEVMRDAMLAASGQLELAMGGPTIASGTAADYGYLDAGRRRSIYVPALRNALPQLFELFDFADTSVVTGQRRASVVAPQALFFLNHPFVLEHARLTAERVLANNSEARLEKMYRLILGRDPAPREREFAEAHLNLGLAEADAWTELCQALFASADFRFLD